MGVRIAVAGATGYASAELLRLLGMHPEFEIGPLTGDASVGQRMSAWQPHLTDLADRVVEPTTPERLADADLVFLAVPHGASGPIAAALPHDVRVVDLGSDHRLTDAATYETYYGGPHLGSWTYGLPELPGQRTKIAGSDRVAATGCHAAAAVLALAPLIEAGLADPEDVVATSVTGASGAGRKLEVRLLASEVMSDLSAYSVGTHRHVPEILQAAGVRSISFTPVLAPLPRGILLTAAARPVQPGVTDQDVRTVLINAYADEPFVRVLPDGLWPHTKATLGSNDCHLQAAIDRSSGRIVVCAALDNLGKGTAGQAIQCANLMLGRPEAMGLPTGGVMP